MIIKNEENNEIKTAKTVVSNMKWELSDREKGNFVQINNEITFLKGDDGNFLTTLPERGLFFSIHCLQGLNWDFNIEGLATLCNSSPETINKYLKKLIKLGYIEKIDNRNKKGQFEKSTYIIHDSIIKENCIEQDYLNKHFPLKEKPNTEKPSSENSGQCNIKNIKELNDLKIKEFKTKEDIYTHPTNKFYSNGITHTSVRTEYDMYNNDSQSNVNMDIQKKNNKKCGKKTKVEKIKEQILPLLDIIEDVELKELLEKFFIIQIEKQCYMHKFRFDELINTLDNLTDDLDEKKQIVKMSIGSGWGNFYPLNPDKKNKILQNKIIETEEDEPEEMEFRDENGNLITF